MWPLAHVINFRFIPNSQRVLYINAVNVSFLVYHNAMYSYTCVSWLMCVNALHISHCLFSAYLSRRWYKQVDLQDLATLHAMPLASVRGFVCFRFAGMSSCVSLQALGRQTRAGPRQLAGSSQAAKSRKQKCRGCWPHCNVAGQAITGSRLLDLV